MKKLLTIPGDPREPSVVETEMEPVLVEDEDVNWVWAWYEGKSFNRFPVYIFWLSDLPKRKVKYYKNEHELLKLSEQGIIPPDRIGRPCDLDN